MPECLICRKVGLLSEALRVCADCLKERPEEARPYIIGAHRRARERFNLPYPVPQESDGISCKICVNECKIGEGKLGFCGIRTNQDGKLVPLAGTPESGLLTYYYDPLPTNCVAAWVCPEARGGGGRRNLAVFLGACSFNCLFCQNWQYHDLTVKCSPTISAEGLAAAVDDRTACVCFFGGDPTPQLPFAFSAASKMLEANPRRSLRICWETDGCMNPSYIPRLAELSLKSGGCVKFDLKAYDENLNIALTGASNKFTLQNFRRLSDYIPQRPEPPFLVASTLLVPGYVDDEEVGQIASFIAQLDRRIPYSLLAFYPSFVMNDLATTSWKQALRCQKAASEAGLTNVKLGNVHLLS